jgi:hypothetical protein
MVKRLVAFALMCVAWPSAATAEESRPDYRRIRAALERPASPGRFAVHRGSVLPLTTSKSQPAGGGQRDSVWNGLLIGAGIGGVGGYVWARNICGSNDSECFAIAAPVGVLAGAGIGAAIGAIADALTR